MHIHNDPLISFLSLNDSLIIVILNNQQRRPRRQLSVPAVVVMEPTSDDGLALRLEALAYVDEAPAPDCRKYAPFNNISPSDLQFQPLHSLSGASSCFVTYSLNTQK